MSDTEIKIQEADLSQAAHADAVLHLVNSYAMDPMGDGQPLSETTRRNLIPGLRAHPTTIIFLAWRGSEPVGVAVCFLGFSTFAARPLLNIHDFYVAPSCRGLGVGRSLLAAVEQHARAKGCCKLTLEVQENNHRARGIYVAAGFARSVYLAEAGGAFFFTKPL